ncbi:MAG: precorrin-8X methylmutase, partial [Pseudomonadota bacterium]
IRDKHYKVIYDNTLCHTCPFCGCERFDAPGAPREALDHYLSKESYAFAAANLRNLVPMGNKCNSRYKLAQDILRTADGARRRSFDPYRHSGIQISLDESQPFDGASGQLGIPLPRWQIDFIPDSDEVTTWDDVFHIRERYERDVLNEGFSSYLREFGNYCKSSGHSPNSEDELLDLIERYISFQQNNGFENLAFFKTAVFQMLRIHCQQGNQRLIKLIKDIVTDVSMVAAGIGTVVKRTWQSSIIPAVQQAPAQILAGQTRSAEGMRWCAQAYPGSIVAVGNAPTALLTLCEDIANQQTQPALVIGAPVGFINVVESKQALSALAVPHILVDGRKGGSAVAAAILNALMIWAWEQQP